MEWSAKWIAPAQEMGDVCPVYEKAFPAEGKIAKAELFITAMGVYEAFLNGKRVGEYVLAPGWTSYEKRHQYQAYDVTALLAEENRLEVTVGKGWYRSPMPGWANEGEKDEKAHVPAGLIAQLILTGEDGSRKVIAYTYIYWRRRARSVSARSMTGRPSTPPFEAKDAQPVVCLDKGRRT